MNSDIVFNIDRGEATTFVMKVFDTTPRELWSYFTDSAKLDLWWAPKPWKCRTKSYDFSENGRWIYAMVGPENEEHYATIQYLEINEGRSISLKDYFSDSEGNLIPEFGLTNWLIGFTGVEEGTKLTINLFHANTEDLDKILEMGFEEGFKACLNQLEDIVEK